MEQPVRPTPSKKPRLSLNTTGLLALADDTGLEVTMRWMDARECMLLAMQGSKPPTKIIVKKLLGEMKGIPQSRRTARFITAVAIAEPSGHTEVFEGVLDGEIAEQPAGVDGFGYDPIFRVPELGKTLAEIPLDQKNQISHRAQALHKAKEILLEKIG